jgi:hypothetical protein
LAKFSGSNHQPRRPAGPTRTAGPTLSHEGGAAYSLDVKSELFTLAVTNLVGETTFYEAASDRDARYRSLVRSATIADLAWVAGFVRWLRHEAFMRSASVVAAAEYVAAGGPNGRAVIDSALSRPDEPGELLGYWLATHGRRIPKPIKRGLGDAARRLYNERAVLKYDTPSHGVRFADVLELAHVKPRADWQRALFRYTLDSRHNRPDISTVGLDTLGLARTVDRIERADRRGALRDFGPQMLADAGYTWERLGGWLPDGMDAEAWETVIPSMGYMALLRNLRNFEKAKVSKVTLRKVADRLADPEQVARSRQFPFRFWTAFRELDAIGSVTFGPALEAALELATRNVPELKGRTLVMVDTSGSMEAAISGRSSVPRVEVAAMFGAAVAARSDVTVWAYASRAGRMRPSASVLGATRDMARIVGQFDHGTNTWPSTAEAIRKDGPFDRVIVFSDLQDHAHGWGCGGGSAPAGIPTYVWDLAGYGKANVDTSKSGHYLLGGFSDASFRLVPLLEAGRTASWPWEIEA